LAAKSDTLDKLTRAIWNSSWEKAFRTLAGLFTLDTWARLERGRQTGLWEDASFESRMSNVMMSMVDLKQAVTFGSTFGKAVNPLGEPTERPVDVDRLIMAEAALIKRLEMHMLKFKNFFASLAYFRLL